MCGRFRRQVMQDVPGDDKSVGRGVGEDDVREASNDSRDRFDLEERLQAHRDDRFHGKGGLTMLPLAKPASPVLEELNGRVDSRQSVRRR